MAIICKDAVLYHAWFNAWDFAFKSKEDLEQGVEEYYQQLKAKAEQVFDNTGREKQPTIARALLTALQEILPYAEADVALLKRLTEEPDTALVLPPLEDDQAANRGQRALSLAYHARAQARKELQP